MSTLLALAPMYAAESYILRVFMTMTSSVVVLGLAFGLLTLPVLLALFGGDRGGAAAAGEGVCLCSVEPQKNTGKLMNQS